MKERVEELLAVGLRCDPVPVTVAVEQMMPRGRGPGLITVELNAIEEKVSVLRCKWVLRDNETYSKVYLKSRHANWSGEKKVRRVREQGKGHFTVYTRYANASSFYEIAQTRSTQMYHNTQQSQSPSVFNTKVKNYKGQN